MKTKIYLIIAFLLLGIYAGHAQSYQKLVDITNKWNYLDMLFTTSGGGEAKTYSFFITTDTVIASKTYKKLMCHVIRQNSNDTVYAKAIREDTVSQSVFIKETEGEDEKEIYSFNHNIGDTIAIDTIASDAYVVRYVKNIDTLEFAGAQRKRIEICDITFRINRPYISPHEDYADFWYEGIGSLTEPFTIHNLGEVTGRIELLCFWNDDKQMYQNPHWDVCEYAIITGLPETLNVPDIGIFQNSANGQIIIKTNEQVDRIMLTDLRGAVMLNQYNKSNIDISHLPNGIYLLKIKTKNKEIVKKMIKNVQNK